jgi:hypothetical protein
MNDHRTAKLDTTVDDLDNEAYTRGRRDGMTWALEYATPEELSDLVEYFKTGRSAEFDANHSVSHFMTGRHIDIASVPHYDNPFWRGFTAGAQEVQDELNPAS